MPSAEIDAIFASKPAKVVTLSSPSKAKRKAKATLSPSEGANSVPKKKTKKKKNKSSSNQDTSQLSSSSQNDVASVTSPKRKYTEPETVFDPSTPGPAVTAKRKKTDTVGVEEASSRETKKKKMTDHDDNDKFRDSRGTGPRRKTDEGFSIYKEDELGIDDQGGDTPLCPFDCDCCF